MVYPLPTKRLTNRSSLHILLFCLTILTVPLIAISSAIASPDDPCLPISMLTPDKVFSSHRIIFAHYFYPFPLSIDNKPATYDYYAKNYLVPNGENNKWLAQGGYLRSRPVSVPRQFTSNYAVENLKKEIKMAIARGIGGFTFDIMTVDNVKQGGILDKLLEAAAQVDSRFQIVLMPDMGAMGPNTDNVFKIIEATYKRPGLFHLLDGRLVIAPFLSEVVTPDAWQALLIKASKEGYKIAFLPTFLSMGPKRADDYAPISDGLGTFGSPAPGQGKANIEAINLAHSLKKPFMAGVNPQGYRPKSYRLWEVEGSLAYRNSWSGVIAGGAEWVQLTTWNDYSESTQVSPFTDATGTPGTGYYNLTGYYATWFLTGKEPVIKHDVLYSFYRKQPATVPTPNQKKPTSLSAGSPPKKDIIELLAFLTKPAKLTITIGDHEYNKDVEAGVQSFVVPLEKGFPHFSMSRNDKKAISFYGNPAISGQDGLPSGYDDLIYWSSSASASGICPIDVLGILK